MSNSKYIDLDVDEIIKETNLAFLLLIDGEELWMPKNQVADSEDYKEGDKELTISITEWIAKQKGL